MRFGDESAKQAVITTLTHICQGGIYDHLGGGYARYSTDEMWLVPHFEKMLYDNALLIDLLTEVWRETQNPLFARRISETVGWLEREMIADGGGFAASLDADSEGEEGKFYVWTSDEILDVLGFEDAAFFAGVYGVTDGGNFEGHTILNRLGSLALLPPADESRLGEMRCKLLARRAPRIRPGWDDKVLADWNGLMIAALSRAALVFDKPEWLAMSERAFACVVDKMSAGGGRLWHSYRAGKARAPATSADYANMSWAALRLHQATSKASYLDKARGWAAILDTHYWDAELFGYRTAADDTADVILKLRPAHDDAVPNANAIQLSNLIALAALTGDNAYASRADDLYNAYTGDLHRAPVGHCGLLAASFDLTSLAQISIHFAASPATDSITSPLRKTLFNKSIPGALEYCFAGDSVGALPVALSGQAASDGKSTAYVCSGPVCGPPLVEPEAFAARLIQVRRLKPVIA